MLGRRDVDIQAQWDNEYRGEEYTNKAINWITRMKQNGAFMDDDAPSNYPYESLSTKQKQAYDIIMAHYNEG